MFTNSHRIFLQILVAFLLLHTLSALTINATNPTIAPNLNIHINMSGSGNFTLYYPSSTSSANLNTMVNFGTKWMQYDTEKKLYISLGDPSLGDSLCVNKWWFFEGKHYTVNYTDNNCSLPACECTSGYGYENETGRYNSTYLAYAGRSYSYKFQAEVDSYAGRALDGVGPLSVLVHVRVADGAYLAMTTLQAKNLTGLSNLLYYNEYVYSSINMTVPNSTYFEVPQVCVDAEKTKNCSEYPFDYYGNPVVKFGYFIEKI